MNFNRKRATHGSTYHFTTTPSSKKTTIINTIYMHRINIYNYTIAQFSSITSLNQEREAHCSRTQPTWTTQHIREQRTQSMEGEGTPQWWRTFLYWLRWRSTQPTLGVGNPWTQPAPLCRGKWTRPRPTFHAHQPIDASLVVPLSLLLAPIFTLEYNIYVSITAHLFTEQPCHRLLHLHWRCHPSASSPYSIRYRQPATSLSAYKWATPGIEVPSL